MSSGVLAPLAGLRVAVVGGGVFGLAVAGAVSLAGGQVALFDPAPPTDNASGVAAGMLSPALEAALDGEEADYPLLRAGYEAWPGFLQRLGLTGLPDIAAGALYLGEPAGVDRLAAQLARLGAPFSRPSAAQVLALQPALAWAGGTAERALHLPAEGRLDPWIMLPALRARLQDLGVRFRVEAHPPRPAAEADATVVACGYGARGWAAAAPELAALTPIKGQVLHFEAGPSEGAVVRTEAGYAAPQRRGLVFGATMEAGRSDAGVDVVAVARLRAAALAVFPVLADAPFQARTGVRAASADGRPVVGRSASGLYLATAARRNGWLLAPLVADAVVQALQGAAARPEFDPARLVPR